MVERIEVGRIAGLSVYPVKSLRGFDVEQATLCSWGLEGDRLWAVVDPDGRVLTQRVLPHMACIRPDRVPGGLRLAADGCPPCAVPIPAPGSATIRVQIWGDAVDAVDAGDEAAGWLSRALGAPARLVYLDKPESARPVDPAYARRGDTVSLADGFPVLACTTASLADLNAHMAPNRVGMDRFRTNMVIETAAPWLEERWTQIGCGDVILDVAKACTRCAVIGVDQASGTRVRATDPLKPLLALRADARGRPIFGRNLVPRGLGTLRVGDAVWATTA